jgi:hypothetical protein
MKEIIFGVLCFIFGALTGGEIVRQLFIKSYRREKNEK